MTPRSPIEVRRYGSEGPSLVVVHGGPGAPGYMAPVARRFAGSFRVFEPLQRGSSDEPLTLARHVADLYGVVDDLGAERRPAILGHSFGAMLALAYAAEHPTRAGPLVLVGCGTFDAEARAALEAERARRCAGIEIEDPDRRLRELAAFYQRIDSYDLVPQADELTGCDARAHEETWADMLRLQEEGYYPAAFRRVASPVLLMHGALDPHPGRRIYAGLARVIDGIEYRELERCGHYPWLERAARDEFFVAVDAWLRRRMPARGWARP